MCGITGFLQRGSRPEARALEATAEAMAATLAQRGPDGAGVWVDAEAGVALAHRRLSIIDLSPEGHQPMVSHSGRYVITYNGEIYNFEALRAQLDDEPSFRGRSDTEVALAAVERWGLVGAVERFVGMFAFALWDRRERVLHLVRDRLGIKPLYYGFCAGAVVFGSELKALRRHPAFAGEVDRTSVALLMRSNYIPAPHAIYRDTYKLMPGCVLSIPAEGEWPAGFVPLPVEEGGPATLQPVSYWSARRVYEEAEAHPFAGDENAAAETLEATLRDAVRGRLVSDVPLGAFLSGGIDSSLVVALMTAEAAQVRTFSIGFHEDGYDEAKHAAAVARHLGTDHTELYVTPADALAVVPRLPSLYDEPFSDSSQIPTYLLSQMTRRYVTVALSGDGGDELFSGYGRYRAAEALGGRVGSVPAVVRRAGARALRALPAETWDRLLAPLGRVLPARLRARARGDTAHKVAEVLAAPDLDAMYAVVVSHWGEPERFVRGATCPPAGVLDPRRHARLRHATRRMMFIDLVTYLPDDILVKVDRASMGVGLEARVPLIDHRVVELAARLPMPMLVSGGAGKQLLRRVLYRRVPRALLERPKKGFGIPLGAWLRGPLRDWAEDLLDEGRLRREGWLHPGPVRQRWEQHLQGTRDWKYYLWDVLMFQAWWQAWRPPTGGG